MGSASQCCMVGKLPHTYYRDVRLVLSRGGKELLLWKLQMHSLVQGHKCVGNVQPRHVESHNDEAVWGAMPICAGPAPAAAPAAAPWASQSTTQPRYRVCVCLHA